MANLSADQLWAEWNALISCWKETRNVWADPVCRDFEKEYLDVLASQFPAVQREMESLAQVIANAKWNVK